MIQILSLSFIVLLYASELLAQVSVPQLRLRGEQADSITGGMPSVMIRRTVPSDHRYMTHHAFSIDPIKMFYYTNLAYHYTLSAAFSVGGEFQTFPGFIRIDNDVDAWGISAEVNCFPFADGPKDFHLTFTSTYYAGTYIYAEAITPFTRREEDFTTASVTLDLGWRFILFYYGSFDLQAGLEHFLVSHDNIKAESLPLITYAPNEEYAFHMTLRFGFQW